MLTRYTFANMIYVLVDGSYYCFYRFFALQVWWRNARKDIELGVPIANEEFVDKYRKTFISKLGDVRKYVAKQYGKDTPVQMWAAKDCPSNSIWRMSLFPGYKQNRSNPEDANVAPFFAMTYEDGLFRTGGCSEILECPKLEADDCVALATKHIIANDPHSEVWIIANDMDYLQLAGPRVHIIDLKFKSLVDSKIVMGDPSDKIPGIFPRCGLKTAIKCYDNPDHMEALLEKHAEAKAKYERNKNLIDFNCIPLHTLVPFVEKLDSLSLSS